MLQTHHPPQVAAIQDDRERERSRASEHRDREREREKERERTRKNDRGSACMSQGGIERGREGHRERDNNRHAYHNPHTSSGSNPG